MKEVKIVKMPVCGGEEFVETKILSYGGVSLNPVGGLRSVALFATVCRDCGSVVRA